MEGPYRSETEYGVHEHIQGDKRIDQLVYELYGTADDAVAIAEETK